jgi:hypothetical protein
MKKITISLIAILLISANYIVAQTNDVTFGILKVDDAMVYIVNLTQMDKETNSPYVYKIRWWNCHLEAERTYKGKTHSGIETNQIPVPVSITVNGIVVPLGDDNHPKFATWQFDKKDAPKGAHWIWGNGEPMGKKGHHEEVNWKEAKAVTNISRCHDHSGFKNTTLNVIITVKPEGKKAWNFSEAPEIVASRMLKSLNANKSNIIFKEANGVQSDFTINITMSESTDGTARYSANVVFTHIESGEIFNEKSGEYTFTSWTDAIDHLSVNMLSWIEQGWKSDPPCLQQDGSVRNK